MDQEDPERSKGLERLSRNAPGQRQPGLAESMSNRPIDPGAPGLKGLNGAGPADYHIKYTVGSLYGVTTFVKNDRGSL